jgi:hypothetical protein
LGELVSVQDVIDKARLDAKLESIRLHYYSAEASWNRGFRIGVLAGAAAALTLTFGVAAYFIINWVQFCA